MKANAAAAATFLLGLGLSSPTSAELREYEFTVQHAISNDDPASLLNLDCYDGRLMTLVDGGHPGPTLRANVGDTVRVKVKNSLTSQSTSIHWHGLHMSEEPYMDGVAKYTQCTLPAGGTQTYEFVARDPGTHFWHSHTALQHSDGMAGPLYVYDKPDKSNDGTYGGGVSSEDGVGPYDGELELFLKDWWHVDSTQQASGLLSEPFRWIFNPQSILVNGRGRHLGAEEECLLEPSVLDVEAGKTYRVRIVNAANLVALNVGIAGHKMTIVEADGTPTKPLEVDLLDVSPGQRYSVLITTDGEPGAEYAVSVHNRARDMKKTAPGRAVLRYGGGGAASDSTTNATEVVDDETGQAVGGVDSVGDTAETGNSTNDVVGVVDDETGKAAVGGEASNSTTTEAAEGEAVSGGDADAASNSTAGPFDRRLEATVTHPDPYFFDAPYGVSFEETLRSKSVPAQDKAEILSAEPDLSYVVVGTQNRRPDDNNLRWAVNNVSLTVPDEITIAYMYDRARELQWADANEELDLGANYVDLPKRPPVTWIYDQDTKNLEPGPGPALNLTAVPIVRAKTGQVVQMVFQNSRALNGAAELHPWHLHGHSFYIVGVGKGNYNPEEHDKTFNLDDPVRRDTFTLWPDSWTAIRFKAYHPGVWDFHCHLNSHLIMGMGFLLVTSPDELDAPPDAARSCTRQSLDLSTDAEVTSSAGSFGKMLPVLLFGWVSTILGMA